MSTEFIMGVQFHHLPKVHYVRFHEPIETQAWVVVDTPKGPELGQVKKQAVPIESFTRQFTVDSVIKKATKDDIRQFERNEEDAKQAFIQAKDIVKNLHLKMDMFRAEYNLDRSKLYFLFVAEERIDFRELVKELANQFHTRIDLRQIGARDRAKLLGAIGVCGLPLCCTSFLNEFDNISINRAKNQMLSLNIPKLTGHCGKLLCCLKYEDDAYTELKESLPKVGSHYRLNQQTYRVSSMNVLTRVIKLQSPEHDIVFMHVDELSKQGQKVHD